jgi:hypothetical protein
MITKTKPKKVCFLRDHAYCWSCQALLESEQFALQEDVCNECIIGDLNDTINSLEAELTKEKAKSKKKKKD